jgi:hypothetical protein
MVMPLDRRLAARGGTLGAELALTASLLDVLPVGPAVVIAVHSEVAVAPLAGRSSTSPAACSDLTGSALTLGVANPDPVPSGASGMSLFNLAVDAVPEALVECVAVGRRYGLTTSTVRAFLPSGPVRTVANPTDQPAEGGCCLALPNNSHLQQLWHLTLPAPCSPARGNARLVALPQPESQPPLVHPPPLPGASLTAILSVGGDRTRDVDLACG